MRIAYLHGGSIPSFFANGVHVMRMCDAFTEAGHEVTLHSLPGSATEDPYAYYGVRHRFPIRLVPAPDHTPDGYRARGEAIRELLTGDGAPDLIYARDPYALAATADLAPFVYEVHQLRRDLPPGAERELLGHPRLARVVVITHELARDLRGAYPDLPGLPVVVAPDAADPPETHAAAATPVLPGRPDAPRIGYVGHLYDGRGIDLILDLAGRLPAFDFHLVGGTAEDRARWEDPCPHPNVYFHGHRPPAALPGYFPLFDVVLAPHQPKVYTWGRLDEIGRWTSPMKLFEYMSHGRAIVASDLPVLREVLEDRVNSLLRPSGSPQAWVDALTELVADEALRGKLGDEARRQFLERHTWRRRADRVVAGLGLPDSAGTGGAR
ncbi:glycosyltransferase family 4 protein [Streptomyces sp. NBC_00536]|uniref:glycosyltransferase family 4 protein n=1 Tax=Streptomyces sp. NBC_00536 TaxID=2975769 RepID=UPI002E819F3A|nr:glycosyltransferase family 4 protein [Streptomyces sp. NBC_00536]WUC82433.1 glycosyltransferase family 4 protein [Streptomyces sp. NBC_00536]